MIATAKPREPRSIASSRIRTGQIATLIIVAQMRDVRNGLSTQNVIVASTARNATDNVACVISTGARLISAIGRLLSVELLSLLVPTERGVLPRVAHHDRDHERKRNHRREVIRETHFVADRFEPQGDRLGPPAEEPRRNRIGQT